MKIKTKKKHWYSRSRDVPYDEGTSNRWKGCVSACTCANVLQLRKCNWRWSGSLPWWWSTESTWSSSDVYCNSQMQVKVELVFLVTHRSVLSCP